MVDDMVSDVVVVVVVVVVVAGDFLVEVKVGVVQVKGAKVVVVAVLVGSFVVRMVHTLSQSLSHGMHGALKGQGQRVKDRGSG